MPSPGFAVHASILPYIALTGWEKGRSHEALNSANGKSLNSNDAVLPRRVPFHSIILMRLRRQLSMLIHVV